MTFISSLLTFQIGRYIKWAGSMLATAVCAGLITLFTGCTEKSDDNLKTMMQSKYGVNHTLKSTAQLPPYAVKTFNGVFVGKEDRGVISYKGIPYAQPPVGKLRWHAPVAVGKSDKIHEAYYFGKSGIQTKAASERASYYPQGEDCLTLNIWTSPASQLSQEKRPVMVFIHGGSYGWGGTSDPLYDGHNLVAAHPNIVLVTINYRVGIMGFLDLTNLKGGESYKESANLGLLDQIEALKWVKRNISGFGGDSTNVTIFGESAGGGSVSILPIMDKAKGLFKRVIAESGSVALTSSKADGKVLTDMLVKETGIDNVDGLMKLSEKQLMEVNEKLNEHNRFPMRDGYLIPLDPYKAYRDGKAKDIVFMTGTNADETRYWIDEMGSENVFKFSINVWYENIISKLSQKEQDGLNTFTNNYPEGKTWGRVEFLNDIMFRIPSTLTAAYHAASGGKTYNYYWDKPSALHNHGACHAVELAYVFGNLNEKIYTGDNISKPLSDAVQQMWVNFATTGDPSLPAHKWPTYNGSTRTTMVLGDNIHTTDKLLEGQRKLIEPLAPLYISPLYDTLSFNVPYIWKWCGGILLAIAVLVVGIIYSVKRMR